MLHRACFLFYLDESVLEPLVDSLYILFWHVDVVVVEVEAEALEMVYFVGHVLVDKLDDLSACSIV